MIDQVYCISLKNNEIRRNLMISQLELEFPNKYEIVDAVTTEDSIVTEAYNNYTTKNSNIETLSQIAICYSHIKCLKKIVENKFVYGAIIEDDIRIKSNVNDLINQYIQNTPGIKDIMNNKPCILHICGPYDYIQKHNKFLDRGDNIIVNICFYIINYQMAQILIDNFLPIKWQFDTYVSKLLKQLNLSEFVACPILAWDLSSTLYDRFWTIEDAKIRKHIFSTSRINKINKISMKPNIYCNNDNTLQNFIFKEILNYYKKFVWINDTSIIHYSNTEINNKTIVGGQGICSLNDHVEQPFLTLFVRGPITRNKFLELSFSCPELYLDPLIIYGVINKNKNNICGRYTFISNFDINFENPHIKILNTKNAKYNDIIIAIKNTEYVISDIYEILVLGTCYNRKSIPFSNFNCDLKFIDYLLGYDSIHKKYNMEQLKFYTLNEINEITKTNDHIFFPQIDFNELKDKQNKLINLLPYLH